MNLTSFVKLCRLQEVGEVEAEVDGVVGHSTEEGESVEAVGEVRGWYFM